MPVKKFVLNNGYYILPENSRAVNDGDCVEVYINGRQVKNLGAYAVTAEQFFGRKSFDYLIPQYPFQGFLEEQYSEIDKFLSANPDMSYIRFDSKTCEDMILFSFFPKFDFAGLDELMANIGRIMPYIMSIFIRPFIHLDSEDFIMPVYAVKKIDRNTVRHIMSHPEHWKSIDDGKIKPARLLTKVYEDDYTIYENKVFCRTTDRLIRLLKKYKNIFTDIIYNKISFELSIADKSNHLYHYLALGKLYVGYAKSDEMFSQRCEDYILRFDRITGAISANHSRPVYKKNRKAKIGRIVRKTNILAMHKDYRHIYKLAKVLDQSEYGGDVGRLADDSSLVGKNYENFCKMLTVFAIGHFRFRTDEDLIFQGGELTRTVFRFAKWRIQLTPVTVSCINTGAVRLTVASGMRRHSTLLIPFMSGISKEGAAFEEAVTGDIAQRHKADNYIFFVAEKLLSPPTYYSGGEISHGVLPLSINDINSFKRIQRLLLDAMIKVSAKHDVCPFCGGEFAKNEHGYFCIKCKTELVSHGCSNCKTEFCYTSVSYPALKDKVVSPESYPPESYWKYCQDKDAQLNYRNITDVTADGLALCPHCNTAVE